MVYKKQKLIINRRNVIKIIGLSFLSSSSLVNSSYATNRYSKITTTKWEGEFLNSPVSIEVHSSNKLLGRKLVKELNSLTSKYENIFNLQNNSSEICFLNKNKKINNPSKELLDLINKSLSISKFSKGSFDITVQPLWEYYYNHFILEGKVKSLGKNDVKKTLKKVNWKNVVVDDRNITLKNQSSITLNGIAQGYVTDKIVDLLKINGVENTLVDFGENFALGKFKEKRAWNILLQGPDNITETIKLSNKAVATSAGYGTSFEPSLKHHHIFNPSTGLSSNKYRTVSIVADKAWIADAISTSCLSMSEKQIKDICTKFSASAYLIKDSKFYKLI